MVYQLFLTLDIKRIKSYTDCMKKHLIQYFGQGNVAEAARKIGIERTRIVMWKEELTQLQKDCVIGALYRQGKDIPKFLLK